MGALYNNELDIVRIGVLQVCVASPKRKYTLITRMPVISGETSLRAVLLGAKALANSKKDLRGSRHRGSQCQPRKVRSVSQHVHTQKDPAVIADKSHARSFAECKVTLLRKLMLNSVQDHYIRDATWLPYGFLLQGRYQGFHKGVTGSDSARASR